MKVQAEIDKGNLNIYIDDSLIKSLKPSFDEQSVFVSYFKYKKERYDFILERIKIMNRIHYKLYLFPLNEFEQNQIDVKVKNQ